MSSQSVEKLQKELERVKDRGVALKRRTDQQAKVVQRDGTAVIAAYAYGAWAKDRRANNQTLPTMFGLDPEIAAAGVAYIAGMVLDGEAAELAHDAGLGIACGYAMKKAST